MPRFPPELREEQMRLGLSQVPGAIDTWCLAASRQAFNRDNAITPLASADGSFFGSEYLTIYFMSK